MKETRRGRRIVRTFLALGAMGLAVHVAWNLGIGRGSGLAWLANDFVYNFVFLCAAAACIARAVTNERQRLAWALLGAAITLSAGGDIYWTILALQPGPVPYPSPADAMYLLTYPCLYAGVGLLVRDRVRLTPSAWIDGAIGGLAAAAVATAVLGPALVGLMEGHVGAAFVNIAYPLADVLMVAFIVMGLIIGGGIRSNARLPALGLALVAWVAADGIFLYQEATSGYQPGLIDDLWLIGALGVALAAAMPEPPAVARREHRSILLPAGFAMAAVAVLAWDHFERLPEASIWLSVATLGAVVLRLVLSFRENSELLSKVRSESVTDALTGLANRRALLADLNEELSHRRSQPTLFAIFDLDGFKVYNDSFGHPAGDLLLRRLGQKLANAVSREGRAYRLGGDEFCILSRAEPGRFRHVLAATSAALSEHGEGFEISSSRGSVRLHEEASEASEALRIADLRMYAEKGRRASSAAHQTREVLVRILREREPELSAHMTDVARMATVIGRRLELSAEDFDVLARAAELHDVGKIGIPDRLLHKPGPLDADEWELIYNHTLIGERILGAVPAMVPVARVVRSAHERWDGDGYPDGLAGLQIPLAARVIAVCDAFDAMVSDRFYSAPVRVEEAVAELRRCAGSQFDPRIVGLFTEALAEGAGRVGQVALEAHALG